MYTSIMPNLILLVVRWFFQFHSPSRCRIIHEAILPYSIQYLIIQTRFCQLCGNKSIKFLKGYGILSLSISPPLPEYRTKYCLILYSIQSLIRQTQCFLHSGNIDVICLMGHYIIGIWQIDYSLRRIFIGIPNGVTFYS